MNTIFLSDDFLSSTIEKPACAGASTGKSTRRTQRVIFKIISLASFASNPLRPLRFSVVILFLIQMLAILSLNSCRHESPVDYVDPFICTQGDHGQWLPAALVPFGLVELSPDTWPGSLTADGDFAHGGYDWSDTHIRGFSHFHKGSSGGTTVRDRAGAISVLPFSAEKADTFFINPVVAADKDSERAEAGCYSVYLPEDKILAELTATLRTGFHRYTFSASGGNSLFIYEGNRGGSGALICTLVDENTLEGSLGNKHFVMEFSEPARNVKIWTGKEIEEGNTLNKPDNGGIIIEFGQLARKRLLVRTGVSLTSVESARSNLMAGSPDWNFNKVRKDASRKWNTLLSKISVEGASAEDKAIFYTALYHTCFLPVIQSDVDGVYTGLDKKQHLAEGYDHYAGYAFWDSFRTKYPLFSLWIPSVFNDISTSLRDLYEQADNWGTLPGSDHSPHGVSFVVRGREGYSTFGECRHEHMLMVVADAYFKGLMKVPVQELYPYMKREVLLQMPEKYDSIGYIPARPDQTGEYCWDNRTLAQVAGALGYEEDYEYLMKRSGYWRNTWDSTIRYFRARAADGTWLDFPEDPAMNREKYTYEGSKWHWRWNVIHDVPSMIDAFGGRDAFNRELEYFFDNDLYTAGNQIDLQAPFLFNMSGAPWLTQKWVRKILKEPIVQKYGTHGFFPEPIFDRVYKSSPDGYLREMDDDYGCMSGWYAMAAMGLYQMCTGFPVYQITAPIFDKVTISLDKEFYNGKKFTIRAENLSDENIYIQSATLNGKSFSKTELTHEEIVNGGELVFIMGSTPNKDWGLK
ncbi:MAG: GH92 family glycosyl hydrolase [Bacteroidales bacterium]|nr:GH92 family glycosyl hydrolase [Bacteroidales bacterium]MBN2634533.1 GH92 family glycosyl hydrolase [Bacteroidales bacterium]